MHDKDGRVTIPGFYDDVPELPADILADLKGLNLTEQKFLGTVGLKHSAGEKGRLVLEQTTTRPTAEFNGDYWRLHRRGRQRPSFPDRPPAKCRSGWWGIRIPEENTRRFPEILVRDRIPADCSVEFGNFGLAGPLQLSFGSGPLTKARQALADEWGKKAVTVGAGGSIPIVADFKSVLGMDLLMVGFALDDDRVHSPNEKFSTSSASTKGIRSRADFGCTGVVAAAT